MMEQSFLLALPGSDLAVASPISVQHVKEPHRLPRTLLLSMTVGGGGGGGGGGEDPIMEPHYLLALPGTDLAVASPVSVQSVEEPHRLPQSLLLNMAVGGGGGDGG